MLRKELEVGFSTQIEENKLKLHQTFISSHYYQFDTIQSGVKCSKGAATYYLWSTQRMRLWLFLSKVNALTMQVASWGAYLLSRNILAVSFAPRDTHEAQVQFALERGVPALIGVLASKRLPYPSRAFDMAHCSRCLIPWGQYGNPARQTINLLNYSRSTNTE